MLIIPPWDFPEKPTERASEGSAPYFFSVLMATSLK